MTQLITQTNPQSPAAEAIRTLRTNLMFRSVEKPIHTLLLTSAANADDKSTLLANLAMTFANSGSKTILVDADMRRPQQAAIWGIDGTQGGLTQMMLNDAMLANPPLVPIDGVDGLSVLPAGELPPSPADLLASTRMDEIIALLKARADYVLFDAPPVLAATDAAILGNKLDGVLLTVRTGKTRREHIAQAKQTLERVHVGILGAVLTDAPKERASDY